MINTNTLKNTTFGTPPFHRKIAIRYIDIVAGVAITREQIFLNYLQGMVYIFFLRRDGNIVAVDSVTPTLFVISEGGDLLRW